MNPKRGSVLVVALGIALLSLGCAGLKSQQPPPLTQEEIIDMARAGKTDDEIVQAIKIRRTYYRLSAEDIIHLHDSGVSNAVIDFMLETYLDAVRDEQYRFDSHYYWHHHHGYWYYTPPHVIVIKKR